MSTVKKKEKDEAANAPMMQLKFFNIRHRTKNLFSS